MAIEVVAPSSVDIGTDILELDTPDESVSTIVELPLNIVSVPASTVIVTDPVTTVIGGVSVIVNVVVSAAVFPIFKLLGVSVV